MTLRFDKEYRLPVHLSNGIKHLQGQTHALFDHVYMKNHGIDEKRWTLDDIIDNYTRISSALKLRHEYEMLRKKATRRNVVDKLQLLRKENREGRRELRLVLNDSFAQKISLCLTDHKDMKRLFANIPIHEMTDRINQRTFLMRKERDRLQCRLQKLMDDLRAKLV